MATSLPRRCDTLSKLRLKNLRLRQRARFTIMVLGALMLSFGLVGWWALQQTQRTAAELQTQALSDVSTAMALAERAAQIAALGPYIGESAVPFQLQQERAQLEDRFAQLNQQVGELSESAFKQGLQARVDTLQAQLQRLTDQVSDELFAREDLMVVRFELADWTARHLAPLEDSQAWADQARTLELSLESIRQMALANPLLPPETEEMLLRLEQQVLAQLERLTPALADNARQELTRLTGEASELLRQRARISAQKSVLFAGTRAQSEDLTRFVQSYVLEVQASVADQRDTLEEAVVRGRIGIILVSLLALLALLEGFWFMARTTRDLESVTRDMTRLAEGETDSHRPVIRRHDEIGDLARTFDVFREASQQMVVVSRELKTQTQLLETVLDTINDGLSVFSSDHRLLAWNQRYLEIFNLSERSITRGMMLADVQQFMARDTYRNMTLDNRVLDMEAVNTLRNDEAQTFERHYHNGKVVEFRSQPMPGGGFVTLYSDMTDRRAVEQQLLQSQKMEVLGQLTGGVAHDFNNLLSALIGNLQLLQASAALPERERDYADRALGVAERGAHLVERLLAFSRKQHLHPEQVEIGDLLAGMLDLIEYSVSPNVEVVLYTEDEGVPVWVDPSQLENAVLNLAINSSAAMPDGGRLTLTTRVVGRATEDARLELSVCDTGVGMSPEVINRIWEPFFTTKPVGQGSGLGLSLVYGFVKQSGGDVLLDSQPGQGTQVRLYFPLSDGKAGAEASDLQVPIAVQVPSGSTVLLVEDDLSVQHTLSDALHSLGFRVQAYASAERALDWLQSHADQVGAVLSDINLAGELSGVELAFRIDETWPVLPVILSSGLPREHLQAHYGLDGDMPLLAKPVRLEQLRQVFGYD